MYLLIASSVSRSISQCESAAPLESESTITAVGIRPSCSTAIMPANMTSTAAQTTSTSMMGKDMIDCAGSLSPSGSSTTLTGASIYKERTISVTSVMTDDGDEPLSLIGEGGGSSIATAGGPTTMGCRYLSVSEEDEYCLSSATANVQQQHQQSVITEQPTATISRSRLEMLANSAVLPQIINNNNLNTQQEQQITISSNLHTIQATVLAETVTFSVEAENKICKPEEKEVVLPIKEIDEDTQILQQQTVLDNAAALSPVHQMSSGGTISTATTSEDSDEYRSLEPKEFDDVQGTEFNNYAPE